MKFTIRIVLSLIIITLCTQSSSAQGTMLLRQPTLSGEDIVFVYADDLWVVDRTGGDARRLTSHEGTESFPHFNQDGSLVAFTGEYGGNTDVYVVPTQGGIPQRLTWHPGPDVVQGWTPDGEIVFRSSREAHPTETNSFYQVSTSGSLPTSVNVTRAAYGELSPDGSKLAYTPITSWDAEWRNYRGGQAMPIWIQDVETGQLDRTPQPDGERHVDPVWMGDVVYYISERDYAANIWSYHPGTKAEQQITQHKVFDVKSLDVHDDDIVYEQGGRLHLIDGSTGQTEPLEIQVRGDMNYSIPRWMDVSATNINHASLSPKGKRAIMEFRGEIVTLPKEEGSARSLTASSAYADRTPIWSPKGDQVAWFSDESGEYKLIIADQYGTVQKSLTIPSKTFYYQPDWSADGEKIAFTDTHYNIWYVDLTSDSFTKVDTDSYAHPNRTMNPVWSPDSRYIAYSKQQESHFKAIFIYDTDTRDSQQITEALADAMDPVFDQSGDYLYFLASTDYGLNSGWLDMSSYDPAISRSLYVSVLHADGKSPFLPSSDEEEEDKKEDKKEMTSDGEDDSIKAIEFDGIVQRVIAAPNATGSYIGLERAPKGKVILLDGEEGPSTAKIYDTEKAKLDDFTAGVVNFVTSYDGAYALYRQGGTWSISKIGGKPDSAKDKLRIDHQVLINPQEEYHQIFKEGWRFMRDFLYVDNVHGAPWEKVWEWYSPWIDHVRHRTDLNYVVDIMSGEVAIGHSYVSGGDFPDIDDVGVGLLGADYEVDSRGYRISKIYDGEHWNPDTYAPLATIGININEGDYISAINGRPLSASDNIYRAMEGLAGEHVRITVTPSSGGDPTTHLVKTVRSERGLRTIDWMEENRKKVDEMSGGELAYVWVPNTSGGGFANFNRFYFSQQDKKGVVIDERNNGGGSAADYMIDVLSREPVGYFNSKAGDRRPWTTPMAGIWGPKVMIINERAGSGGDLLPYMFKLRELGPLVGTKTWGGLVGTWDTPRFIDGGRMVAPRGGFYDLDGEWAVEGEGIAPDIEVIMDPAVVLTGRDPQLEAAVQEALRLLKTERYELQPEPAAPIRSKRPVGWQQEK